MAEETFEVLVTIFWILIPVVFTIGLIRQSLNEEDISSKSYEAFQQEAELDEDDDRAA